MARPRNSRKINYSPKVRFFKPTGLNIGEREEITISPEEIDALRLIELKGLSQTKAAHTMNTSQPTFSRTLTSARHKVARAVVLGKAIKIEGGNVLINKPLSLKDFIDLK